MQEKILSVVIPYFEETQSELLLPVSSVAGQAGIDIGNIECILVNDGNRNELSGEFLSLFSPLNVRCVYLPENKGPGCARQAGAEAANGEYVMFCDADDSLHNILVLKTFFEEFEKDRPDIIYSSIMMERYDPDTRTSSFPVHNDPRHLMHGKAYKKAFLEEKGVRFHEKLRLYEDTYFNGLAFACGTNVRSIDITSYVRKYRPTSLTRADDFSYFLKILPEYIKCMGYLCDELTTKKPEMLTEYMTKYTVYFYFTLQKRHWKEDGKSALLEKAERAFKETMIPHIRYFDEAPEEHIASAYAGFRPDYFTGETETEPLRDWVERMKTV